MAPTRFSPCSDRWHGGGVSRPGHAARPNDSHQVFNEQFSARFAREARAVAQLNPPHICQLSLAPDYLVMEYVDGVPLRGPLPVEQAVAYARQICGALGGRPA